MSNDSESDSLSLERRALRRSLRRVMTATQSPEADRPELVGEDKFGELSLRTFRYQTRAIPAYGAFVRARGIDPHSIQSWRDIPPVPARAFRELPLDSGGEEFEAVFRTSGTTGGSGARGVHRVRDLSLYRESLIHTATRYLRPDLQTPETIGTRIRVLVLTPPPSRHPESSLLYMFGVWKAAWDDGRGGFLADAEWRVPGERLREEIDRARSDGTRVLLAGTAFAFVNVLDGLEGAPPVSLPPGSLVVETGGFKGRSRTVSRSDLYQAVSSMFDVPLRRIVSEYGMTELLSQFYEPVLLEDGPDLPQARRHRGPPWVRTRILDPHTLDPVNPGDPGILCHLDLANLDSVASVLTEDVGVAAGDGFRLLGRSEGSEPRGCSLMMEDLLDANTPAADR